MRRREMVCALRSMTCASMASGAGRASSSGLTAGSSGSGRGGVVSGSLVIESSRASGYELTFALVRVVLPLVVIVIAAVDDEEHPVPSRLCEEMVSHVAELVQPLAEVRVRDGLRSVE